MPRSISSRMIGRRINVVGNTCAGKSALAATLAERLGVPFVELDALNWQPNWVEAPRDMLRERMAEATAGDAWVVAGNYSAHSAATFWPRLETAVWLDYPLPLLLRRVVTRSYRRWRTNELLWGTNRERFWLHFYHRDSLIWWAIKSHRSRRRRLESTMTNPQWAHISFTRLRSPQETERWLAEALPAAG